MARASVMLFIWPGALTVAVAVTIRIVGIRKPDNRWRRSWQQYHSGNQRQSFIRRGYLFGRRPLLQSGCISFPYTKSQTRNATEHLVLHRLPDRGNWGKRKSLGPITVYWCIDRRSFWRGIIFPASEFQRKQQSAHHLLKIRKPCIESVSTPPCTVLFILSGSIKRRTAVYHWS